MPQLPWSGGHIHNASRPHQRQGTGNGSDHNQWDVICCREGDLLRRRHLSAGLRSLLLWAQVRAGVSVAGRHVPLSSLSSVSIALDWRSHSSKTLKSRLILHERLTRLRKKLEASTKDFWVIRIGEEPKFSTGFGHIQLQLALEHLEKHLFSCFVFLTSGY